MLSFLIAGLVLIIFIEILLHFLVPFIKKDFQWILTKADEYPLINDEKLIKFLNTNYSEETGWDRKPDTSGFEKNKEYKTFFEISKNGYRESKNIFNKVKYLIFGDSFAFCRYVNDNETWEYFLENLIEMNVRNYGVGNFGVDQAIIKYHNLSDKEDANHIILSFVPETILRVHSYWKHYIEFGNIYGFKPKFKYSDNKLELLPNVLEKKFTTKDIISKIDYIKLNDVFYKQRFLKLMFKFPYIINYFRNFSRNNIIFLNILIYKLFKTFKKNDYEIYFEKAWYRIIEDNISLSHKLYNDKDFTILMKKIITDFHSKLKEEKKNLSLVIFPQIQDIEASIKNRSCYQKFFKDLNNEMKVLDLTDYFLNYKDYKSLYLNDSYGGHLSSNGNKFVASIIKKELFDINKL